MSPPTNAEADLDLAQRCLEGDEQALQHYRDTIAPRLSASLISAGASASEAEEIAGSLWADCVCGGKACPPRLTRYRGQCSLLGWLKSVAINQLIDLKRRSTRWQRISDELRHEDAPTRSGSAILSDPPLIDLLKSAVTRSLAACPSQPLVMLQLRHVNGLTQRELAAIWGWHESKVSRLLADTIADIAREVAREVKKTDPWLTLSWDDFLELCRCADFSIFV